MGRQPVPKPVNPLRNMRPVREPTPLVQRASVAAATQSAANRPAKRACPNKECSQPKVEDGVCHNCGTVVDDSNIVAEVQFGESSSGAAVVQGSFVGADQGAARSLGPGFRRAGGDENRESTQKEGKTIMQGLANQLQVPNSTVEAGLAIFKLAAMNNFIQGRRMDMVAAVCLYTACRREKPCRVMLIDFADKSQVNVFKLGRTFKALHRALSLSNNGLQPVLPEDLIYRFAMKLEFGHMTSKVAEDAVRLVQRMSYDWMVMGRRPSGVCGACLIVAARMNNFRRTISEVVYIVKVTTATIQKRLDEFKLTKSSALTVEEFLNNEFIEDPQDPPSFYEKSEEFLKEKAKKKRKRGGHDGIEVPEETLGAEGNANQQNKRQKTANAADTIPTVELRRDADGFAIPPTPTTTGRENIDPRLLEEANSALSENPGTVDLEALAKKFGDALDEADDELDEEVDDGVNDEVDLELSPRARSRSRSRAAEVDVRVPEAWDSMERRLEQEISEMVNDPHTTEHAIEYARAVKRARIHMLVAEANNPQKPVCMDRHIGEDEFADDREVQDCILDPAEVAKKEKVWFNENKSWLRKQQLKEYQKKMAANGPPKATRNRTKKPRIGEGQVEPAATAQEAAEKMIQKRAYSKKINYAAFNKMFESQGQGSQLGSAATSRVTSRAGSVAPSIPESIVADENENEEDEDEEEEEDEEEAAPDWRKTVQQSVANLDEFEDEEEFDDPGMGDIDENFGAENDLDLDDDDDDAGFDD